MKSRRWRLLLLALPVVIAPVLFQGQQDLHEPPSNLKQTFDRAMEATFEIKCESWVGTGWGLELDGESYVVTAQHVIEDCLNGEFIGGANPTTSLFSLELVASDGAYWEGGQLDLALLKAGRQIKSLQLQMHEPQLGQWVMAVGYPLDDPWEDHLPSITQGMITGIDGNGLVVTDAAINPGNSGGPLINSRGEVVATMFASDDPAEYEDLAYGQPLRFHCRLIFACADGKFRYERPRD